MPKPKTITVKDEIKFDALHDQYGRAEFCICPIYKRGYLKELFIQALQQERKDTQWILELPKGKWTDFSIKSRATFGTHIDQPSIWRQGWCKEHKTIYNEIYVPNNTSKIGFKLYFGNTLDINFE